MDAISDGINSVIARRFPFVLMEGSNKFQWYEYNCCPVVLAISGNYSRGSSSGGGGREHDETRGGTRRRTAVKKFNGIHI